MHRRTRRGNRLGLTFVGVVLLAAGAAVLLAHFGVFGARAAAASLYPRGGSDWIAEHRWSYWIAAALAAVAVLIALRWLLVQLRTDRVSRLSVDSDRSTGPDAGITTVTAGAVADAVGDAAERIRGVRSAHAAVSGHRDAPELWLTVTLDDDADADAVRTALQYRVVGDARTALERPDLPVYLTLDVSRGHKARAGR